MKDFVTLPLHAEFKAAFWRHERWSVDVRDGMDDIALAFTADAWSRTGRVRVDAAASGSVTLRSGLVLVAQPAAQSKPRLPLAPALKPVQQLDRTLSEIAERFGTARREWVMMELEYAGDDPDGQARHVEPFHLAGNVGLEFRDQRPNAILNGRAGLGLFRCQRHVLKVKAGQRGDRQDDRKAPRIQR